MAERPDAHEEDAGSPGESPLFADWCGVDILDERGLRRRLGVFHRDLEKLRLAHELNATYPPDSAQATGVYGVLRSGRVDDRAMLALQLEAVAGRPVVSSASGSRAPA